MHWAPRKVEGYEDLKRALTEELGYEVSEVGVSDEGWGGKCFVCHQDLPREGWHLDVKSPDLDGNPAFAGHYCCDRHKCRQRWAKYELAREKALASVVAVEKMG